MHAVSTDDSWLTAMGKFCVGDVSDEALFGWAMQHHVSSIFILD